MRNIIASIHQNPRARPWVMVGLFPLFLLSLIYSSAMRVRRWCYRVGVFTVRRLPATVVCVGNITTGGTGKTPAVVHLARRLACSGINTAVISRGYGYEITGDHLIVSGPDRVYLRAGQAPDEALMTAQKLPGVPVVVSPDRYRAGRAALESFGAEVLVMDDGFQHLGLFRDIDVLVVDGDNATGNGLVLPAGPLREPVSGAGRAHVVWLYGRKGGGLSGRLSKVLEAKPLVRARMTPAGLSTCEGAREGQCPAGTRVSAFCGIARPGRFFEAVARTGFVVVDRAAFPDHHRFSGQDVESLNRQAHEAGAEMMITTEKDLARLPDAAAFALPVAALVMELVVEGDEALIQMITTLVKEKRA